MFDKMEELNIQYVLAHKNVGVLEKYESRIITEINGAESSDISSIVKMIGMLSELISEVDCSEFELLKDTEQIGNQYIKVLNTINELKRGLIQNPSDASVLSKLVDQNVTAKSRYTELETAFEKKYNLDLDPQKNLNHIIVRSVKQALATEESSISRILSEARQIADAEYTTELKKTDPISEDNMLPEEMLVARIPLQRVVMRLMLDIGIRNTYKNVNVDLKNQGNVMISSNPESLDHRHIDEFIIAYILRTLETFPLGTVNVHIFSRNANYLYKRLSNVFQSETAGEITKKTIQLHSSLDDLTRLSDVSINDISKKHQFQSLTCSRFLRKTVLIRLT